MNETLEIWIIMLAAFGLFGIAGWMWGFARDRKPDSFVAILIYSILFSIITYAALFFSLVLFNDIYHMFMNSSWIYKLIICVCIGVYLAFKYDQKLKQREYDKKIIKVVVYWGTNDNKKPSEYYTKEVIPANRDKFSEAEVNAIYKDMDIMRNLTMLGKGQFS